LLIGQLAVSRGQGAGAFALSVLLNFNGGALLVANAWPNQKKNTITLDFLIVELLFLSLKGSVSRVGEKRL
jgi:hypothetical protein